MTGVIAIKKILIRILILVASMCYIYFFDFTLKIDLLHKIFLFLLNIILLLTLSIYDKKILKTDYKKNGIKLVYLFSLVLTLLSVMLSNSLETSPIKQAKLKFEALDKRDKESNGSEVWIKKITVDGINQNLKMMDITNTDWIYNDKGNGLFSNGETSNSIMQVNLKYKNKIVITFDSHAWCGYVKVTNGDKEKIINLYNESSKTLEYTIKKNQHISSIVVLYNIVKIICYYLLILYGFRILFNNIIKKSQFNFIDTKIDTFLKSIKLLIENNKWLIIVIIGILAIRYVYFITNQIAYLYADSYGYIEFNFSKLMNLDFTQGRTPVYPIILRIFQKIFGETNFLLFVCYFQMAVSFSAIIYFYKTLKMISKRNWLVYGMTFLFGASNTFSGYDFVILTESLALSGVIFFIYFLVKYLKSNNIKYGINSVILMFFLTFLRPSFLLFDAIILMFLLIQQLITRRKEIFKIIVVNVICWFGILFYCFLFFNSTGIFTISDPMPRQLLVICIDRDYYLDSDDKEYVKFIEDSIKSNSTTWESVWDALSHFGLKRTESFAKECIKNNLSKYLKNEISESVINANCNFISYNIAKEDINKNMYDLRNLTIGFFDVLKPIHALILATYFLIITIKGLFFEKKIYWLACGFCVFIISIFISSMIATCGEYIRTMIHMFPFIYIGLAYLLELKIDRNDYFTDRLVIK